MWVERYITKIYIEQVRHLKDIQIELNKEKRQHLILTGKNGSGKTSVLEALRSFLEMIQKGLYDYLLDMYKTQQAVSDTEKKDFGLFLQEMKAPSSGVFAQFSDGNLSSCYLAGTFITAYFSASRTTEISLPRGVEEIQLKNVYGMEENPTTDLLKYMVHLKTQQIYAKNEGDADTENRIKDWFQQFEDALRKLMADPSIQLHYDYKNYNFLIHQKDRNPYDFSQLSDGYSAAVRILADLLMRMDQNWLQKDVTVEKTLEGIVLIDEIETHLHLELQRSILPFLTEMFPNLQFIVTTHSPFVVNSLENAAIYDLEKNLMVKSGLTNVSYKGVVEGFFQSDALSNELREKYERYKELIQKNSLTDDEYDEIMSLELYLDEIPDYLSIGIATEYKKQKLEFWQREDNK